MRNLHSDSFIPLSPIHYQILISLLEGPSHGYGLRDKVRLDSEGILELSTSTIYLALKSLQRIKYIESAGNEAGAGSPHARIKYQLTSSGRFVLEQETGRLRAVVALAKKRLQTP